MIPVTNAGAVENRDLPPGFVITASGRISGAAEPEQATPRYPFATMDLVRLDDELTYGTRACKARLAVYIGDLGDHSAAQARRRGRRVGVQIWRRLDARPDPGGARAGNAGTIRACQAGTRRL